MRLERQKWLGKWLPAHTHTFAAIEPPSFLNNSNSKYTKIKKKLVIISNERFLHISLWNSSMLLLFLFDFFHAHIFCLFLFLFNQINLNYLFVKELEIENSKYVEKSFPVVFIGRNTLRFTNQHYDDDHHYSNFDCLACLHCHQLDCL